MGVESALENAQNIENGKEQCSVKASKHIERFQIAAEGETIPFAAKMGDLGGDWLPATATKKSDHFEVVFDKSPSEVVQYFFEDEQKSLLSENLWEIGWYKLLKLEDRSTSTDEPSANEVIGSDLGNSPIDEASVSIVHNFKGNCFEGELLSGEKCKFFESVERGDGTKSLCFAAKDAVVSDSKNALFFLLCSPFMDQNLVPLFSPSIRIFHHSFLFLS